MTYSYGRALQQSALKFWSKDIKNIEGTQKVFNHRANMCTLAAQGKWSAELEQNKTNKKFVYLISPNKIKNDNFYNDLALVFSSKKVSFFQLRLKEQKSRRNLLLEKRFKQFAKNIKLNFLINDDPMLAKKLNADGCHLGQKDMSLIKARKILKNKIIGITCHNSINLAKKAISSGANYLAFGAFYTSQTKKSNIRQT